MIQFDYNYFMDAHIGSEHGVSEKELEGMQGSARAALERMEREKSAGSLGFLEIPFDRKVIADIKAFRAECADRFDTIAIIGIGGSALGPQALKNALSHLYLNELDAAKRAGPCDVSHVTETEVESHCAGTIWQARKRFQMRSYSLNCSA